MLDNAEHLVDAVGQVVTDLGGALPDIRLLVTSQVPLAVRNEHVYRLEPLDSPSAVALFAARAIAADRRFALSDANAEGVAAICRQIDGLPLAIELAAREAFSWAREHDAALAIDLAATAARHTVRSPRRPEALGWLASCEPIVSETIPRKIRALWWLEFARFRIFNRHAEGANAACLAGYARARNAHIVMTDVTIDYLAKVDALVRASLAESDVAALTTQGAHWSDEEAFRAAFESSEA